MLDVVVFLLSLSIAEVDVVDDCFCGVFLQFCAVDVDFAFSPLRAGSLFGDVALDAPFDDSFVVSSFVGDDFVD